MIQNVSYDSSPLDVCVSVNLLGLILMHKLQRLAFNNFVVVLFEVALTTEIPDYNQMTLPLGGGHSATAAQMRHFCRSYEFQLPPPLPSSMSPPLPPPSTVQFSTLGPGGRHVYCNIPMTLLNGQVRRGEHTNNHRLHYVTSSGHILLP